MGTDRASDESRQQLRWERRVKIIRDPDLALQHADTCSMTKKMGR